MSERILAEAAIEVGHHDTAKWLGLTVNVDTIMATAIAAVIVIALAFVLRAKVTSTGVPSGVQLLWETLTTQMRGQIESAIGMKIAPFVLPLAVALFIFILIANWISVLPVQYGKADGSTHELLKPPAADINFVLALALFVFFCYHAAGIWRRGLIGHPVKLLKGHVAFLAPINLVEELAKPISLSLRLFRQHLRGRHHGRADRVVPAVHHVGAQRDLEDVRPVRRFDPGVHLRASDDSVLQPVDGTGRRPPLKKDVFDPRTTHSPGRSPTSNQGG